MAATRKRPNYVTELVDKTNATLKVRKIISVNDSLFSFIQLYLIRKNMYEGFGFFRTETKNIDGKEVKVDVMLKGDEYIDKNTFLKLF